MNWRTADAPDRLPGRRTAALSIVLTPGSWMTPPPGWRIAPVIIPLPIPGRIPMAPPGWRIAPVITPPPVPGRIPMTPPPGWVAVPTVPVPGIIPAAHLQVSFPRQPCIDTPCRFIRHACCGSGIACHTGHGQRATQSHHKNLQDLNHGLILSCDREVDGQLPV